MGKVELCRLICNKKGADIWQDSDRMQRDKETAEEAGRVSEALEGRV